MTTFPLGINKIRSVNVDTDINVISNVESISGKREVVLGDQIKQTIQLNTVPLTETEDRQFQIFLKQTKNYGLIELPLSNLSVFKPISNLTDEVTVNGAHSVGSTLIELNPTPTLGFPLELGSYIQFNNIDTIGPKKIHQITALTVTGPVITTAIAGFVGASGVVINTIEGQPVDTAGGQFLINGNSENIYTFGFFNNISNTLAQVTLGGIAFDSSNPFTNDCTAGDTIQIIDDPSLLRTAIISPGLDTSITDNTKVNYRNLIGQFRADNGSFNSQSGTLLNDGTTTKTYRFRLTEEL